VRLTSSRLCDAIDRSGCEGASNRPVRDIPAKGAFQLRNRHGSEASGDRSDCVAVISGMWVCAASNRSNQDYRNQRKTAPYDRSLCTTSHAPL
jgi:hypothetical protein